jgi:hypothetical protein
MKIELEKYEVEYIDSVLHDKYFIYSNKDPIIQQIRDKLESAEDEAWHEYVMSKVTW